MAREFVVTFPDGTQRTYTEGVRLLDILQDVRPETGEYPIVAAHVDHKLVSLHYKPVDDIHLEFVDQSSLDGIRVYERSAAFLLTAAAARVFPGQKLYVLHHYSNGLYCEFENRRELSEEDLLRLKETMKQMVEADLPIVPQAIDEESGVKFFRRIRSREDAVLLFKYMPEHQRIFVYRMENFIDYSYLPLVPSTGVLRKFDLLRYPPGLVLLLPERTDPRLLMPLRERPKLFNTFEESARWVRILGVQNAGALNQLIARGNVSDFVKIAEALHEKRIAAIADEITRIRREQNLRFVFIAGPSSSGKTTFTKRLAIQLRVNELQPVVISLDNYFVDREKTPRDENGEPDFDALEALDLPLLEDHLQRLWRGEEVEIPKFNFKTGRRSPKGWRLRLSPSQIVLMEGIHALNPRISGMVPEEARYRIYVSALTQIGIDAHNRISTSDTRLIRRIVRDHLFRGHSALDTLRMWGNVRRNEERQIFPYQENVDTMFNSALLYELAVLKLYAEPLLEEISPEVPEYADAVRLITLLSHFLGMLPTEVPPTSILREFIGGSSFRY